MNRLSWLFNLMLFIGVGAYILNFFGILETVFNNNRILFLIMMWIGMIGTLFINKKIKK